MCVRHRWPLSRAGVVLIATRFSRYLGFSGLVRGIISRCEGAQSSSSVRHGADFNVVDGCKDAARFGAGEAERI